MAKPDVEITIRNIRGDYSPFSIFQFFDNGIRKRVPKLIARKFTEEIKSNIDSNVFGFTLSDRWQRYKKAIGADERPYIMFGSYKNAITTVVDDKGHIAVGFKKTAMHPRAKIAIGKLAIQLEFGNLDRGIPARPIWRMSAKKFFLRKAMIGRWISDEIKKGIK